MAFGLLYVLLMINTFELARENPIYSYRFKVYPVDRCPMNATEFETAARIRNCTEDSRYLCAPDKFLSNLIEFCTDRRRGLFREGNCLLLEGSGDLNHYNCVERFNNGCSLAPYFDDEIFKYPSCLIINREFKCFVADKGCPERISVTREVNLNESTHENGRKTESFNASLLNVILTTISIVIVGVIIALVIYTRRKKKKAADSLNIAALEFNLEETSEEEVKVDERKLKDFLNNGELTVCHVRCIIVGCAGAGKTTLLKRLEDIPYDSLKDVQSTDVVDVHVNSFEVLEDEETIQSVNRKNELPSIIFSSKMVERKMTRDGQTSNTARKFTDKNDKPEEESGKEYKFKVKIKNKERCRTELKTINVKEHTEESDHSDDESNEEQKFGFNTMNYYTSATCSGKKEEGTETKKTDHSSRKKLIFTEQYESEDENTTEESKLLSFSEVEQTLMKENTKEICELHFKPAGKTSQKCEEKSLLHVQSDVPLVITSEETKDEERKESKHEEFEENRHKNLENRREINCKDIENNQDLNDNEKYAISKIMDVVKQVSTETHLHPRITFLDFAGQSAYYAFHQIYLSPKTCYILVVDMTKSPDEQDIEIDERTGSRFESWTFKDFYKFWLKSIDSYSDTKTPVILVGTHAEKKSKQDCRKFFKDFFKMIKDHHPDLRRHLNLDRKFAIGFPEPESELKDLIEIKKCIAQIVLEPEYSEKHIRPVWAVFEQILLRQKANRIISRKELLEINEKNKAFRMNDDEIREMLLFLHRVGSLLYFDDEALKETIILDIQWFVNAFKCIITYPVNIRNTDNDRERFHKTGEISDRELTNIWENEEYGQEYIFHKAIIMSFMEQLGLLACIESRVLGENCVWYYIPSMNKRPIPKQDKKFTKSSILCFQFDINGQLPIFLFHGVVLKCMKIPQWSLLRENKENCIYENLVCFGFQSHIVVICLCKFQIQVQVWLPGEGVIDQDFLQNVLLLVENKIKQNEKIREKKEFSFQIGYKCQNGKLNDETDATFIAEAEFHISSKLICEKCKVDEKHFVDNKICWTQIEKPAIEEFHPFPQANEEIDEGLSSKNHILKACTDGNIENFNFHLKKEISQRKQILMTPDSKGWNVLHEAAKGGNIRIFNTLVAENLNVCQKTDDQMTVLHIASKYGNFNICEYILDNEDFKECVNDISSQGKNACHYAAEAGSVKIIRLLIKKGINPKALTKTKLNIFHIACVYNQLEMCEFIAINFHALMFKTSNEEWNATLHAAKNDNTIILEFLHKKGVNIEHNSVSKRNALHVACDNGHLNACKYLSDKFPHLLEALDHKGRHASHFAVRSGKIEVLKYLETKTKLTKETYTGMNILHMACLHDHIKMCKYILDWYPNLNVEQTEKGWTTAHFVAGRGNNKGNEIKIFEMLLKAKKPVNMMALTRKGNSVLTLAIKYNVYELAEYLFENHPNLLTIHGANKPSETGNENPEMLGLLHRYSDIYK